MPTADILIIGGGPAGLSTAGALKQVGLEATILDKGERIGQSWDERYERLHLHTVRAYSGLAHFPIPNNIAKYPSKGQYADYLRAYAAHFNLHFVPKTIVKRVRQENDHGQAVWEVETEAEQWRSRVVVIATGQYGQSIQPEWPGLADFKGDTIHSAEFKTGREFLGKRVLVVGAGNSGMEIAVDLVEQGAAKTAVSVRTAPPVVPRDFLGTPAQVFGIVMNSLPPSISDQVGIFFARLAFGDLSKYGLPHQTWGPFSSHRTPVIDVGFVAALKAGKVGVRQGVRSFTSCGVVYSDGHEEEFDCVIFATGFRSGLEDLLEPEGLLDKNGNPRNGSGKTTGCPGLYFMGYFDSLRGFLYESNLASKRMAKEIRKYLG